MAGYRARGGQNRSNNANSKNRPSGNAEASRQTAGNRQPKQPPRERSGRSSGARPATGREPRGEREFAPGEFFTLGEHTVGRRRYRFRYNGKVYRIMEGLAQPKPPAAEPDSTSVVVETAVATESVEGLRLEETAQETVTVVAAQPEPEETLVLEETDAKKAYEAWNRIKRPERYGL